jgi:hypothetical protein
MLLLRFRKRAVWAVPGKRGLGLVCEAALLLDSNAAGPCIGVLAAHVVWDLERWLGTDWASVMLLA